MELSSGKKTNLFLIEDDPDDIDYLKELLDGEEQFSLTHAGTLNQGVKAIQAGSYEVILLDLSLPDSRGMDTLKQLIALVPDLPVIVLTGQLGEEVGIDSIKYGAQDFLIKGSFDQEGLINSILYSIERHHFLVESRFSNRFLKANLVYFKHLIEFSQKLNKHLSLRNIFRVLREKIKVLCFSELYSLFFLDRDKLKLVSHNHPEWKNLLDPYYVEMGEGIMWDAIQEKKILKVDNFSSSKYSKPGTSRYKDDVAISIPLLVENQTVGVLNLNNPLIPDFSRDILLKLETVILHLSMAINNTLLHKKIEELSITDELTGVFNRRYLMGQLQGEIKRVKQYHTPLSILMLDIDFFKQVNDSLGHVAGDLVLMHLAGIIKGGIRKIDTPGRYGGEEFIVILPNTPLLRAEEVAEEIRKKTSASEVDLGEDGKVSISVSIGVAEYTPSILDAIELIKHADAALYQAKDRGKNRVVVYQETSLSEYNPAYIVKIFFLQPLDVISVVVDTLIKMDFEAYAIALEERQKLLGILDKKIRNVFFICIAGKNEIDEWLSYIRMLEELEGYSIQIGAFVYDEMDTDTRLLFLERNISTISFSDLKNDTLSMIKKVLLYFEARGKRKHIRASSYGSSEAFIKIPDQDLPVKGEIVNLSIYSLACGFELPVLELFKVGDFLDDVLLVLRGSYLQVAARVLGIDKDNPHICFLQVCGRNPRNQNSCELEPEIKNKLYNYIRQCLKEDIKKRLCL